MAIRIGANPICWTNDDMPELGWPFGYPMALGMMVVSAIIPYAWFKFRDWL